MKKFLLATFIVLLALGNVNTASAQSVDTNVGVVGGTLSFVPEPFDFSNATINSESVTVLEKSINNRIVDSRGSGGGWSVSLSASNFISDAVPDNSNSRAGSTMTIRFPENSLKVGNWSIYRNNDYGQEIDPVNGPLKLTAPLVTLNSTPIQLIEAKKGFGMGSYINNLNFVLTVPYKGYVQSLSEAATSGYTLDQEVGIRATNYKATFTYTLTSGI
ncbi:WxL domain-containing protein [Paenibacillus sp. GCM10027627]|uniref:WxL domain-containing protein n=1 Tax=unclassified Paenibacillus TaxID=185978 RepID=UPI003630F587